MTRLAVTAGLAGNVRNQATRNDQPSNQLGSPPMFGFARAPRPALKEGLLPEMIAVGGRSLALETVRSPRASRLTLRIARDGRSARLTAPPHVREREMADFLARHMGWLESKLAAYPERPVLRPGVKVPVRGMPHLIIAQSGRGVTRLVQGEAGPEIHVFGAREAAARRIADFLKKEARATIEPMAMRDAAQTGRKFRSIRFRDTSSRWGSCSHDGQLSFSWRIMMAPPKVIAYLVAHEVAHLTEMNHGPQFWALCRTLCPDTDTCRAWLKRNGGKLQAIAFE
jgi:predicted metal-dependent hydrolase